MKRIFLSLDWILVASVLAVAFLGLTTMKSFSAGAEDYFFERQLIWIFVGLFVFFTAILIDWNFLITNSIFLLILYLILIGALAFLLFFGQATRGAASWFSFYSIKIEPVELMKPFLVLILAKYFSRRHVEIARFSTLFISGLYAAIPAALVLLQPDFGSASILAMAWLGMALVAGINFRHLAFLGVSAVLAAFLFWNFFLWPYQQARIAAFLNPASDARGAGYHSLQSMIAIGSGQIFGKGIGYGTQSRLAFLPEHETDFIFAAFAEEWGLVGVSALFLFFGIIIWRIIKRGVYGESNFEKLYAAGFAIILFLQAGIHVGMNSGIFPVTGLGMPFLSYGGSSIVSLLFGLGILESFAARKKGIFLGKEARFEEGILGA